MIRIALVEDNKQNAEELSACLTRYAEETGQEFMIQWFENGKVFIERFHKCWDIVILDNEMPEMSGMETARALRKLDEQACLVFVTNLTEYAMESYQVQASDYILKPVNYHELYMKLEKILKNPVNQRGESLVIAVRGRWHRIPLAKLAYIEARGHWLIYHTEKEMIETIDGRTLQELEEKLAGKGFFRCYKSYLVNLSFVSDVGMECILWNGTKIPVSRGKRQELKRRLLDYFSGRML